MVDQVGSNSKLLRSGSCLALVAALALAMPAHADFASTLRSQLESYYANPGGGGPPCIREALEEFHALDSSDLVLRRRGAASLVVALQTLLDDEKNHPGAVVPVPYWGVGAEQEPSPARELRTRIMDAVGSYFPRDDVFLPVLAWVFRNETIEGSLGDAVIVLHSIKSEEATSLFAEAVKEARVPADVLLDCMRNLIERDPERAASLLSRYANYHDASVQNVARAFLQSRGEKLGPPDGRAALASLEPILRKALELLPEPLTAAPFVSIRYPHRSPFAAQAAQKELRGFLLPEADASKYRILTVFLDIRTVDRGLPLDDADRTLIPLADEVQRIESIRSRIRQGDDDAAEGLFEDGMLTGQFQSRRISGYEILLAAELHRRNDSDLAARVLLPPLDGMNSAEGLLPILRQQLGTQLFHGMLERFVGERDYRGAIAIARHLTAHFDGASGVSQARVLAEQLPHRLDEFVTFRMPTREEWSVLQKSMSRVEQIDFLCDHLRLLNAFQAGQPGGVDFNGPQYVEPSGLIDAAWSAGRGKTEVLNPLSALDALQLEISDIPALAPHLLDDRVIPTVEFWRDFHPGRTLYRVGELVGWRIDALAHEQLVPRDGLFQLDGSRQAAEIARITSWAKERGTATQSSRLLEVVAGKKNWSEFTWGILRELAERHVVEALPLLFDFLDRPETTDADRARILFHAAGIDRPETAKVAAGYLTSNDPSLQLQAGMICMEGEDRDTARRALREGIAASTASTDRISVNNSIVALLKTGEAEDLEAAKAVLERPYMNDSFGRFESTSLACLFKDHEGIAARFFLSRLDVIEPQQHYRDGKTRWQEPFGYVVAREAMSCFGDRINLHWPQTGSLAEKQAVFALFKRWLVEEVERSEASPAMP